MVNRRGRPLGFKLSEESKRAISESKKGQRHKQATKDKISRTLMLYFRKLNPLSEEITNTYCRADDDEACNWMNDVADDIDETEDILTDRFMKNIRKTEISYGHNIEYFSHSMTPERIMILKEVCEAEGMDVKELISLITAMKDT